MIVSSRSFEEYTAFFGLDPTNLPASILDCSAGASSFTVEAHRRGVRAVAVDPAYAEPAELLGRARVSLADGQQLITDNEGRYTYGWYGSPQRRAAMRTQALSAFIADYPTAPERYLVGALPNLPLSDGSFELALCSHLLFTWADTFDRDWHLAALLELLRVAGQVRVFPLVHQGDGAPVDWLPQLRQQLARQFGVQTDVVEVAYEFQVGARHMLSARRT
jgi:hypothetical protein